MTIDIIADDADQPAHPWSTMEVWAVIICPVYSDREVRNIRRNVSRNGTRNDKSFRVRLNRKTTPMTVRVERVR
jgi:hypothetical protein